MRGVKEIIHYRVMVLKPSIYSKRDLFSSIHRFQGKNIPLLFSPHIPPGKATSGGGDLNVHAENKVQRVSFEVYFIVLFGLFCFLIRVSLHRFLSLSLF